MQTDIVAVLGAIGGALTGAIVGGVINYVSSKGLENREWRLALARDQAASRQKLYGEFLVATQRLVSQSRDGKNSSLTDLNAVNEKFAEVCLVASETVVQEAQKLKDYALTSHCQPTAAEAANKFQLMEAFIAAARKEAATVLGDA